MATYNFNTSAPGSSNVTDRSTQKSLLSKTFLYMFFFLLITVAVSIGVSLIFRACGLSVDNPGSDVPESVEKAYIITMITASITQIVLTVVIAFTSLKRGKAAAIPIILYAVCMGVLLSSFGFLLNWWTLATAFAISALAFAGMALIGAFSKNATGLGMVGFGLLFGMMLTSLFAGLMFLFLGPGPLLVYTIVTSAIIVIAVMLITAYDVYNIKQISMRCGADSNLAFYLAFNLYLDFIIIFIHIIRLIAIFSNRR